MCLRFKKKPFIIDAVRWDGTNTDEISDRIYAPESGQSEKVKSIRREVLKNAYDIMEGSLIHKGDFITKFSDGSIFAIPARKFKRLARRCKYETKNY